MLKKRIVIFDLDGTACNNAHRKGLIECPKEQQNWPLFYKLCPGDLPIQPVIDIAKLLYPFYEIVIMTGRSDIVMEETREWMKHYGMPWDRLFMRPDAERAADHELKKAWVTQLGIENIHCVFDDRNSVVKMFRELGLTVFQPAEGDF